MGNPPAKTNRLAGEKSPYLLQHAHNPVDWYPWGEEAFKKAKNDGKPVFLSIGYSTCHWCHVMAHESFEDPGIAAIINKNFIPIKVDREERPEVDSYYMGAVQSMTGGGGWPLSVFLTPELKPFYGGTYFPPEPRYGMPSFRQVLEFVANLWKDKRSQAIDNSLEIAKALSEERTSTGTPLGKALFDEGAAAILANFDQEHGGFGSQPKFPLPLTGSFLLRYHFRTGKELALTAVAKTLDGMMSGGIRDHVGGGFHRYSTDRHWLVPHFEKMLYDNALLATLYVDAYLVTGREEYARVAKETLSWIRAEMTDDGGGFYSAQDADTAEGEGVYYTWTPEEVEDILGAEDGASFCRTFGVTRTGNFGGRTILHLGSGADEDGRSTEWKAKLYEKRLTRTRPGTDTKVLTSWNGLAISAMSRAGRALSESDYVGHASKAADFILNRCSREGRLLRRYAGGEAALGGTLEDYAFFVRGLVDLFEASQDPKWLKEAVRLADIMIDEFEDKRKGGFYLSSETVPARLKEGYDGPTPSGNSMAAIALMLLAELTGDKKFREAAERTLKSFAGDLERQPTGEAAMLSALDLLINGVREIVVTSPTLSESKQMMEVISSRYLPESVTIVATKKTHAALSVMSSLLEGRKPTPHPRAYVCRNFACDLPAEDAKALQRQLSGRGG